jgi:hypothetical protein
MPSLGLIDREYLDGSHLEGQGEYINVNLGPRLVISCLLCNKRFGVISQNPTSVGLVGFSSPCFFPLPTSVAQSGPKSRSADTAGFQAVCCSVRCQGCSMAAKNREVNRVLASVHSGGRESRPEHQ